MPHEKHLEWVRTDLLDYAEKAIFPQRVHASTDARSPFDTCAESHSRCDILDRENPADAVGGFAGDGTNERNSAIVLPPVRQG